MPHKLLAPFPYFGGKSLACKPVWEAFGAVANYVEPFMGSAAMLLGAPEEKRIETVNDFDGFVSNFWRAVKHVPNEVAEYADWPVNENDLFARHGWLVRQRNELTNKLHGDPDFYDAKVAGYWVWGMCAWIGGGWCSGRGPWVYNGNEMVTYKQRLDFDDAEQGIKRQLPHLGTAWCGINKKLPHFGDAGRGINRQIPNTKKRHAFILQWMDALCVRLGDVRIACGDWKRVLSDSVTVRHGLTAVFLDPPYAKGDMDYGSGGMGLGIDANVMAWCIENGNNLKLRIVLCGHAGDHDELLTRGWSVRKWRAKKGYALSKEAKQNTASETLWCSPHCVPEMDSQRSVFEI